jgi:hypothetical protein
MTPHHTKVLHTKARTLATVEGMVWYLELLQSFSDDWLTGCLFMTQSHQSLNGLLEGFSMNCEMSRLHDN